MFTDAEYFADGLHVGEYEALTAGVGPEIAARFVRRPYIPVYFLDVRPPTMLPRYSDAMDIVWSIIDMAFSSAVITPGQTTCDDVGWWMWEAVRASGYTCDFMPDVGVQRSGAGERCANSISSARKSVGLQYTGTLF